jgi:hypothetical protein
MIVYTEFNISGKIAMLKYLAVGIVRLFLIIVLSQYVFMGVLVENARSAKTRQIELLDYRNQTLETLRSSYPWADIDSAYSRIGILEKNRWSVFSQ